MIRWGFYLWSTDMHNLSEYQRRILLENTNVEKITEKFVVYTSGFKVKTVKQYLNGESPNDIFLKANIPIELFIKGYCLSCIKRWKKKYLEQGPESLKEDKRGHATIGRPKKENLDELTYEELQAMVEVQRGLIEELKKKKALAKKKY